MDVNRFKDTAGNWLEADAWPKIRAEVTCHTPGCAAKGTTQTVDLAENIDGVSRVECGHCGKPPEVREVPDAGP
jgi:hypothetical protein